jgi:multidrug transporter EmrE-like cation transporter
MAALHTWSAIAVIVATSTAGDVLTARAMKEVGHVGDVYRAKGFRGVVRAIFGNGYFGAGIICMAVSFFTLLAVLSWADVSLVGPAAASLTFIANAFAAKLFLGEDVTHHRWLAAGLVACGVALLAF